MKLIIFNLILTFPFSLYGVDVICNISLDYEIKRLPCIKVDKSIEFCGEQIEDPILYTKNKKIKNVLIYVKNPPIKVFKQKDISIHSEKCLFYPRIQATTKGSYLHIKSQDNTPHNPHGWWENKTTFFNLTLLNPSISFKRKFKKIGQYRIDCDTHAWMKAYIHVFDHSFYAISDLRGNAVIKDLPKGSYQLNIWHEVLGEKSIDINVTDQHIIEKNITYSFQDTRREEFKPNLLYPWP